MQKVVKTAEWVLNPSCAFESRMAVLHEYSLGLDFLEVRSRERKIDRLHLIQNRRNSLHQRFSVRVFKVQNFGLRLTEILKKIWLEYGDYF